MLAAVEIYNKPQMSYRDECFTILLVNAWELLAKAILSKNKQNIYRKKIRGQPYRTLQLSEALKKASRFFPEAIPYQPVQENIKHLARYRNSTIHFYNEPGFGVAIYGFAQTCIVNYKDLVLAVFDQDITAEITFTLLPLGLGSAPDPIAYLRDSSTKPSNNRFVAQTISTEIVETLHGVSERCKTWILGRFLSQVRCKSLQST